jgi:hypothetical protein
MTRLAEIQEAIDKLVPHERDQLMEWLLKHYDGVEESDELIAAAEEGVRSLEEGGSIPIEEVQKRFAAKWGIR